MPQVGIPSADKYVHSIFHFLFTIFWFLHFDATSDRKVSLNLIIVFVLSLLFGVAIEFAQAVLTISRKAEVADVVANTYGAIAGVVSMIIFHFVKTNKQ